MPFKRIFYNKVATLIAWEFPHRGQTPVFLRRTHIILQKNHVFFGDLP
ncbi:hypothetical protein LEP1GSC070_2366 [Leptospira santarosai str. AIM]|nr:hypothetical protein LEP1GSC070_2366 [Leptospira santarosai str. AIM]